MSEYLRITPHGYATDETGTKWTTLESKQGRVVHNGIRPTLLPALSRRGYLDVQQGKRSKTEATEPLYRLEQLKDYAGKIPLPTVYMKPNYLDSRWGEVSPAESDGKLWVDTGNIIARALWRMGQNQRIPAWNLVHEVPYAEQIDELITHDAVDWQLGRYGEEVVVEDMGGLYDTHGREPDRHFTRDLGRLAILVSEPDAEDMVQLLAEQ